MSRKRYTIDMSSGAIAPKMIRFALPVLAASALQLMFNTADVIVVGKFVGDVSQAAVTSTSPLVGLIVNLFIGLATGANVIAGQAIGSGDRQRVSRVVHTAVLISIFGGAAVGLVGILLSPALLRIVETPDTVFPLSDLYLKVYFVGVPANVIYNFGAALLRAAGDTRRPMYYITFSGILNVVLNLIFVVFFHWDVAGVAAATAISHYVSAWLVIRALQRERDALRLELRRLTLDSAMAWGIVRVGLPSGVTASVYALSNVTVQSAINSLGSLVMAGSGAAANIGTFVQLGATTFGSAITSFTSQNYGAVKCRRIDQGVKWGLLLSGGMILSVGVMVLSFAPGLMGLFTNDPLVAEQGVLRMKIVIPGSLFLAVTEIFTGTLRGMGWSVGPMLATLACTCGLRMLWVVTVFRAEPTALSLYYSYPLGWLAGAVVLTGLFFLKRRSLYKQAEQVCRGTQQENRIQ